MHVCLHRILQLGAASSKEQRQPLFSLDTPGHADGILLSFSARQLDFRQRLPRDPLCPCFSESLSSSCSSVSSSYVDFGFGFMMKRASESGRPEARNFWRASSRESARTVKMTSRLVRPMK